MLQENYSSYSVLKILPKYLDFEDISKICICVSEPLGLF